MSAASTPVPRTKSPTDARPSGPRYSLFWPLLIFLFGAGALALYQVITMQDQLEEVTLTVDKMDARIQRAQYEKTKFYSIARDVLQLASKNANAEQVATYFKLRQLQQAQPELMALGTQTPVTATKGPLVTTPASETNAAPVPSSEGTNIAPIPAAK